ncbi:MAG: thermonuclease family protein [Gammaproteobacteria bacterium]|nr:thermonuclease family protein [Gammaproteobacteria bacterium]
MKTDILAKPEEYRYRVFDFRLYDGDTYTCGAEVQYRIQVDLGFERTAYLDFTQHETFTVRLYGFDTPELRDKRPAHKAAGYLAKQAVVDWVNQAHARGDVYFLSEQYEKGKYGRPMGDLVDADGRRVSEYLVAKRLAVPYHGQNKADIQAQHEANVQYLLAEGLIT